MANQEIVIPQFQLFIEELNQLLHKHLPSMPAGTLVYTQTCLKEMQIDDELKAKCFIPLYHGLLNIGLMDHQGHFKEGLFAPLSKYLQTPAKTVYLQ